MNIQQNIEDFIEQHGRRPRMLVSGMQQNSDDNGAKIIATAFADAGFDVDLAPVFSTAAEVARQAIENDVHAVGLSSQAAAHMTVVPALIAELKSQGAEEILLVVGGDVPVSDYEFLKQAGVKGIIASNSDITPLAKQVIDAFDGCL